MPAYQAPIDDIRFLLEDVLQIRRYDNLPGFADASGEVVAAMLEEAGKFCEQVLVPLNRTGDLEGCVRHQDGRVTTPRGFQAAFRQFADGGWMGLAAPAQFGGQGLPGVLAVAVNEMLVSANMSFAMYPGLTQGSVAALIRHGTPAQQATYLPRMIEGRWTGTMNLTESQCGTDLGLLRTKATPQADDSYRISGTKIFISAGEHDLAENIVHLVLARIDGAPAGVRGISLFVVPKFLPATDGTLGARNAVACGSIEHKMGIHGNATCVMNYDGATGWLIGEEHRELNAMFTMMNEARLGVGVQGLALSEVAYQNAAAYAKERLQGRALAGAKFPDRPADPIIVHPDVRRMLLTVRAFNEAARALVLWTALRGDVASRADDEKARLEADDHLGLLVPVIKGVLTDRGFANTVLAQQVYGGHGYIAEHGMEQFVRDARIAMLYEGANGIQALDLVGRKLAKDDGRALRAFLGELASYLGAQRDAADMQPFVRPLGVALGHLQQATTWLMQHAAGNPDDAGAASTDYMHLLGLVALGYMWCRIVQAANAKLAGGGDAERMRAKLVVGRFFMERILPETATRLARIQAGATSTMELPAEGILITAVPVSARSDFETPSMRGARMVETTQHEALQALTGGCQCGAVRYALTAVPDEASVCHCRMCQKASGGPIMAFARVKDDQLHWTRGRPAAFRSSNLAERHFCAACGTPLTYHFIDSGNISVTACSLDDPEAVRPSLQYCVDRALSWFAGIGGLPGQRVDEVITEELAARFVDHQHPDHET